MIFEKSASSSWLLAQSNELRLWGGSRQIQVCSEESFRDRDEVFAGRFKLVAATRWRQEILREKRSGFRQQAPICRLWRLHSRLLSASSCR
jgi:hypothetical protein